jgi:hypothetical protein
MRVIPDDGLNGFISKADVMSTETTASKRARDQVTLCDI